MTISYTQLPDFRQFIQTYFADQELLDTTTGASATDESLDIPEFGAGGEIIITDPGVSPSPVVEISESDGDFLPGVNIVNIESAAGNYDGGS